MGLQSEMLVNATVTLSDAELASVEHFKGYPEGLMIVSMTFCVIFMLFGIPGNILTILALARYKKVRNVTAIFIISLSCMDLLFCCFNLPLETSKFHHGAWIHGQFLCHMTHTTTYALVVNSSFTVLAITITRYIIIVYPKLYTKLYKKRNIIIMLVFSWILTFVIMIPIVFEEFGHFDLYVSKRSCLILGNQSKRSIKKFIFLTAFILPCTIIILCYTRIFCVVRKATKKSLRIGNSIPNPVGFTGKAGCNHMLKREKTVKLGLKKNKNTTDRSTNLEMSDKIKIRSKILEQEPPKLHRTTLKKSMKYLKMALPNRRDRRLGTMIIAIIISYFLCYLPIMIIKVFLERNLHPKLNVAAHILFYLSHCLNPIIYVVMSNEYRKAYKYLFKRQSTFFLNRTKIPNLSKIQLNVLKQQYFGKFIYSYYLSKHVLHVF